MNNEKSQTHELLRCEVLLNHADDFLKIRETLTRIGIASSKENTIYQSCHILHKQGRYYIVHFKELFILDGREETILEKEDVQRRNAIASLLSDWGLLAIVRESDILNNTCDLHNIKIISYAEKANWTLIPKYSIGKFSKKAY